jgi:hypothetical protein
MNLSILNPTVAMIYSNLHRTITAIAPVAPANNSGNGKDQQDRSKKSKSPLYDNRLPKGQLIDFTV